MEPQRSLISLRIVRDHPPHVRAITFDAAMNAPGKGRIASPTSVDGVNKGSKTADMIRGIIPVGSGVEGGRQPWQMHLVR